MQQVWFCTEIVKILHTQLNSYKKSTKITDINAFTLFLLVCKIFGLKIQSCKLFAKSQVCTSSLVMGKPTLLKVVYFAGCPIRKIKNKKNYFEKLLRWLAQSFCYHREWYTLLDGQSGKLWIWRTENYIDVEQMPERDLFWLLVLKKETKKRK